MQPLAIQRLGKSIFVPQQARRLLPEEYEVVYTDPVYFENWDRDSIEKHVRDFAIALNNEKKFSSETITTYADRQKDSTGIALGGNEGSGRAVYYGDRFNIIGVGKTTLCKSAIPSHSTGALELIGAMRRIIISRWISYFTQRAPIHPVLIALKKTTTVKWNTHPIPIGLLVRIDNGSLDRPSHIEQAPEISIRFEKSITEYAKLDAECFAHRILQGAWSTSNYSLRGHIIDLEATSFVTYRGPSYTSSSKYPHNRFGYEGLGLLRVLQQLANVKNIKDKEIESRFYKKRRQHLGRCLLSLLGVEHGAASYFFQKYQGQVIDVSAEFERLSKKVGGHIANSNLYTPVSDEQDLSLLDMSKLFRSLANIHRYSNPETKAFECLVRKDALSRISPGPMPTPNNQAEAFIHDNAVVPVEQIGYFLNETRNFITALFRLLALLESEKCFDKTTNWNARLYAMNQDMPPMFALNQELAALAESYRLGKLESRKLGAEIKTLCELPKRNFTEVS